MKYLALIIFLFSTSLSCYSQINNQGDENTQKLFYIKKIEKYRKMRNTGKFCAVVGGILFIGGIVTMVDGAHDYYSYNASQSPASKQSASSQMNRGSTAFSIGVLGLGAGIPFWIIGGHSREKYERKLRNLSVSFNRNNAGTGIALAYHF